eukprot:gene12069-8623_t
MMESSIWIESFHQGRSHGWMQVQAILYPWSGMYLIHPDYGCQSFVGGNIAVYAIGEVESVATDEAPVTHIFKITLSQSTCKESFSLGFESLQSATSWNSQIHDFKVRSFFVRLCEESSGSPSPTLLHGLCAQQHEKVEYTNVPLQTKSWEIIDLHLQRCAIDGSLLHTLRFVNVSLTDKLAHQLAALLRNCPFLQHLDVSKNYLTSKSLPAIAAALQDKKYLRGLVLEENYFGDDHVGALLVALSKLQRLSALSFSRNNLTGDVAAEFSKRVLTFQSKLTHVDFSYNFVGDRMACAVATLMRNDPAHLQHVNLAYCGIGDKGLRELAASMPRCGSLAQLNIEGNFFGPDAVQTLVATLNAQPLRSAVRVNFGGSIQTSGSIDFFQAKSLKAASSALPESSFVDCVVLQKLPNKVVNAYGSARLRVMTDGVDGADGFLPAGDIPLLIVALTGCEASQWTLAQSQGTSLVAGAPRDESLFRTFAVGDPLNARQQQIEALHHTLLLLQRVSQPYESRPTAAFQKCVQLCAQSDAKLRLLGVRAAHFSSSVGLLQSYGASDVSLSLLRPGYGGRGVDDDYVPPFGEVAAAELLRQPDADATRGDSAHSAHVDALVVSRQLESDAAAAELSAVEDIFAEENRAREARQVNERLVLAVRRLYEAKEISAQVAKFWEGLFGNKKYARLAESELMRAMEVDVEGDEFGAVLRQYAHLFPAVARRLLLYDLMFARNVASLGAVLAKTRENEGGEAFVLGKRLASEISNLKETFRKLQMIAKTRKELPLVENFLLDCGKCGYGGDEMFEAVSLRARLVAQRKAADADFARIKARAMVANLLISRDFDALRAKLREIRDSGDEVLQVSEEARIAELFLREHEAAHAQLREALGAPSIAALDAALARCAYLGFYFAAEMEQAIQLLDALGRNPASLLRPVLQALRTNDMALLERGFEDIALMGLQHAALDSVVCSKINAIKSKIVQDDSLKGQMVKVSLALKNGFSVPTGEILQLIRRATASQFDQDAQMKPYYKVLMQHSKKYSGLQRQERAIQELIAQNDVLRLSKLLSGRGTGKLVMSFPTAFAMEQWLAKLKAVADAVASGAADPAADRREEIVFKGIFDKAARSASGELRSWRRRFFVLGTTHLAYFTRPGGKKKGYIRVLNGGVRRMHLAETGGRAFCLELEEGRDLSLVSPDLIDEARRRVRLAKILEVESFLKVGIARRSAELLAKMLGFAKALGVMLDYGLMTEARHVLRQVRESSIKRDLYRLVRDFPKAAAVAEALQLAQSLNVDPQSPSLARLRQLVQLSDFDQEVYRAQVLLRAGGADGRLPATLVLLHRSLQAQPTQRKRRYFLSVVLEFVGLAAQRAQRLHALPPPFVAQLIRQSVQLCSSLRSEVEVLDLARCCVKFLAPLLAQHAAGADLIGGAHDLRSLGSETDLALFVRRVEAFPGLQHQHRITKYPLLRSSVEKKSGLWQALRLRGRSPAKEIMSHAPQPIAKSLLKLDKELAHDGGTLCCLEIFVVLQVLMGDAPLAQLPRPSRAKIVSAQTNRSRESLFFQLLGCLSAKYAVFRDEMFFQLSKQLTQNPSAASALQGWLLFAVFAHALAPSAAALPFLLHFAQDSVAKLAADAFAPPVAAAAPSAERPLDGGDGDGDGDESDAASAVSGAPPPPPPQPPAAAEAAQDWQRLLPVARYALFVLRGLASGGAAEATEATAARLLALEPAQKTRFYRLVFEQEPLAVDVVLLTGEVLAVALPFGQLHAPHELLRHVVRQTVPVQAMAELDALSSAADGAASDGHRGERFLNEIEQFYDEPQPPLAAQAAASAAAKGAASPAASTGALELQAAEQLLRGFSLARLDAAVVDADGRVDLRRLPLQPRAKSLVAWDADLQWELLWRLLQAPEAGDDADDDATALARPTFALRGDGCDAQDGVLDDFCIYGDEFSDREQLQRTALCRAWLAAGPATGAPLLPRDFLRVDLVFAEDTRLVNSRLAPLPPESFHYLLALQLALSWTDDEWQLALQADGDLPRPAPGARRSSRRQSMRSVASTARRGGALEVAGVDVATQPSYLHERAASVFRRHLQALRLGDARELQSQASRAELDDASGASLDSDDVLRQLERERVQLERWDSLSSGGDDSDGDSYASSAGDARPDADAADDDDDPDVAQRRRRLQWRPQPVAADDELSPEHMRLLLHLLQRLGVDADAVALELLWPHIAAFHQLAADCRVALTQPRLRYLLKRAYHDYLVAVCAVYGDRLVATTLSRVEVDAAVRLEQEALVHAAADFDARDVLLLLSRDGLRVLASDDWSLLFAASFWDVVDYDFEPDERSGRVALLELNVNGLKLLFEDAVEVTAPPLPAERNALDDVLFLLSALSREALAFGRFPGGSAETFETFTEAPGAVLALRQAQAWDQRFAARFQSRLQDFLNTYAALPVPPASSAGGDASGAQVVGLRRAEAALTAPPSRRDLAALERDEEERLQRELAKLALEAQLEKSQQLLAEGREAVHRKRDHSGGAGDAEDNERDDDDAAAAGDAPADAPGGTARRKHRSVFNRHHRGTEDLGGLIVRDRVASMVCGVSPKDSATFSERFAAPLLPTRVGGVVRHAPHGDAELPTVAEGAAGGRRTAAPVALAPPLPHADSEADDAEDADVGALLSEVALTQLPRLLQREEAELLRLRRCALVLEELRDGDRPAAVTAADAVDAEGDGAEENKSDADARAPRAAYAVGLHRLLAAQERKRRRFVAG